MAHKIRSFIYNNGLYPFLLEVSQRMAGAFRGTLYSRTLKTTGMVIGKDAYIRGARTISIGTGFVAGKNLWLDAVHRYENNQYSPKITIGNNVGLSDSVHIAATNSVVLGDNVLVGSRVLITDHSHGIYRGEDQSDPEQPPSKRKLSSDRKVSIASNVWIGDGVVVLPGAHIGEGSIIGANSVVTGEIPPRCIAIGSPARPVRRYDDLSKEWKQWKHE